MRGVVMILALAACDGPSAATVDDVASAEALDAAEATIAGLTASLADLTDDVDALRARVVALEAANESRGSGGDVVEEIRCGADVGPVAWLQAVEPWSAFVVEWRGDTPSVQIDPWGDVNDAACTAGVDRLTLIRR